MNIHRVSMRLFLFIGFTLLIFSCSGDIGQLTSGTKIAYPSEGVMTINGKDLRADLAILPDGKIQLWGPWDNHSIGREELEEIITDQVKVLIIGTGYQDGAFLTAEGANYVDEIKQQGVTVHMLNTHEAVKLFNSSPREGLLACFHLNC